MDHRRASYVVLPIKMTAPLQKLGTKEYDYFSKFCDLNLFTQFIHGTRSWGGVLSGLVPDSVTLLIESQRASVRIAIAVIYGGAENSIHVQVREFCPMKNIYTSDFSRLKLPDIYIIVLTAPLKITCPLCSRSTSLRTKLPALSLHERHVCRDETSN